MKKLSLTFLAAMFCLAAAAQKQYLRFNPQTTQWEKITEQSSKIDTKHFFEDTELIFEGRIVGYEKLLDTIRVDSNEIYGKSYGVYKVEISHVYKGESRINIGTIAIVDMHAIANVTIDENFGRLDWGIDYDYIIPPTPLPENGIYFCKMSDKTPAGNTYPASYTTENNVVLQKSDQSINLHTLEWNTGGMEKVKFGAITELYRFIKQQGLHVPTEKLKKETDEDQQVKKKDASGSLNVKQRNEERYARNLSNYNSYMKKLLSKNPAQRKSSQVENLSFSFANGQVTGTNPRFYEFDVMVEGNTNNTYFANCLLRIEYDTIAFGSNLVANNKVTITKGANYNTVTYIDPDANAIDQTSSVLGVPFGDDFNQSSWNRTQVTTFPDQMLHFSIEIKDCFRNADINFTDTSFTPTFSLYTQNSTDDFFNTFSYDNTFYQNSLNEVMCQLNIFNFTSPVYPGTFSIGAGTTETWEMVIQGIGFGSARGSGNVYFPNAHNGGQNYTLLNGRDFISWSDNEIRIRMPSVIDTSLYPAGDNRMPGSGIFYVKTDAGDSVLSSFPVDMPYGIKNVIDPGVPEGKIRVDLANFDQSDSVAIMFRLDTSITNHPDPLVEAAVRQAVKDWRCETLVYFEVSDTPTTQTAEKDGISTIFLTDTIGTITTLARTMPNGKTCADVNGNKRVLITELDIGIKRTPPFGFTWHYNTTGNLPSGQRDFYEVILHEVGHCNLLSHAQATTSAGNDDKLMYYTGLQGPQLSQDRRFIDTDARDGGFIVVDKGNQLDLGTASCISSGVSTLLLSPDETCATLPGFDELVKDNAGLNDFNLYPNPFHSGFNVSYDVSNNSKVKFILYDYLGREVNSLEEKTVPAGQHMQFINTGQLNAGVYFLLTSVNGYRIATKVIKAQY